MPEFVIPLDKDELLKHIPGQYIVENIVSVRNLPEAIDGVKSSLAKKGPFFILDHFDTFFSFLLHKNKVDFPVTLRAFDRLVKGLELLVQNIGNIEDINGLDVEEKKQFRRVCKMMAYLVSNFICNINNQIYNIEDNNIHIGRKKKAAKKSDNEEEWEDRRQNVFLLIFRWVQYPIQQFWHPPIAEDAFITCITQACYKVLETLKETSMKQLSETIFEILGTFIKRYNYGLTCVIHFIQLVKTYENLAVPMSQGILYMTTKCQCKGLIEKIIQEMGNTQIEDSNAKNISTFLETLSSQPSLLLPVLEDLTDYLSNDNYVMRNCIIDIIGKIVLECLTGENLDEKQKERRDMCLDILFEHILDINAYVRSKVLQVWFRLFTEGAVPLTRQVKLLKCSSLRLEDKSAFVRKNALQILRALLQGNPFAARMNKKNIEEQLRKAEKDLTVIQAEVVAESGPGADVRYELWESHGPIIYNTIKDILTDKENQDKYTEEEEINDENFEKIRQLMLHGKIKKAVILTNKISRQVYSLKGFDEIDEESHTKGLLALLYKIFIDSENVKEMDFVKEINDSEKQQNERICQVKREKIKSAKTLVSYLQECLEFANELEKALPIVENLLFSVILGDAVEACTFLGTAYQFGITGAEKGFSKALFQVFYRDQSVCKNVAAVYKNIYLSSEPNQTERSKALSNVNKLLELVQGLEGGQVKALSHLMALWRKNKDIDNEIIKVLWETFALKITNSTPLKSRGALLLLTLIAQSEPSIIIENLEALIKIGFGPRTKDDLLLARDTCRALLKIKQTNSDINVPPIRYPNDHEIFTKVETILLENFSTLEEKGFVSFAVEAINVIYHLADQPEEIIKHILLEISKYNRENDDLKIPAIVLRNYLITVGHIAIRQMVHLDTSVYKELKRRNALRDIRKSTNIASKRSGSGLDVSRISTKSASHSVRYKELNNSSIIDDNISHGGEEALEGASADDADAEYIHNCLEKDLLNEKSLLYKFSLTVLEVCQNPDKYNDADVQAAGVLALTKFMTISSTFCKQQLQLLVTILQKTPYPGIRSNIIIGLTDLMSRFPNQVEPWTSHIYGRLQDSDVGVRTTCVKMLSSLIMREMIRVKGQVAELALCIMDSDTNIQQLTKQFFKDLSQKGNSLYNIMPDIISCLTNPERNIEEDKFQEVIKFILSLLQKEKHIDSIVEKICARFKIATTDSQFQNLSYCLSLLQFNVKSIRYLIEFLPQMKDIIHHKAVYKAMNYITDQGKKKVETKDLAIELDEKINELLDSPENAEALTDKMAMPPPQSSKAPLRRKTKRTKSKHDSSDSESDDDSETNRKSRQRNKKKQNNSSSDSNSDSEVNRKSRQSSRLKGRKNKLSDSDDDSDTAPMKNTPRSRRHNTRQNSSDSGSDNDTVYETPRKGITRKQKLPASSRKTGISPLEKKGRPSRSTDPSPLTRSRRAKK